MIERFALPGFVGRLREPRRFLQVVAGPRQAGKTTMVAQALARLSLACGTKTRASAATCGWWCLAPHPCSSSAG